MQNWGDLPRNEGKLLYYNEVFVDIPHDVEQEKNLDVFIFPLLMKHMLQNNCSNKLWDD